MAQNDERGSCAAFGSVPSEEIPLPCQGKSALSATASGEINALEPTVARVSQNRYADAMNNEAPNDHNETIARLEALEAHVAHQERVIADLNEVVTGQYRKIERLERLVERLRESMLSLPQQREGPEPPPPHY